jgi:Ca2+-binding RTX toxin-like protein
MKKGYFMNTLKNISIVYALATAMLFANISEPDITFYGQITTQVGNIKVPITEGTLRWEILPKEDTDKHYNFSTKLENIDNGKYSYHLNIPQEILVSMETLTTKDSNVLTIQEQKDLLFEHYNIRVNGEKALLSNEGLNFFKVNEEGRSRYIRLDLLVSPKALLNNGDSDLNKNGIDDIWEITFNITDAEADTDGDGWSNREEFSYGTNPLVNNKVPLLRTDSSNTEENDANLSFQIFENALTQLRVEIIDSDTDLSEITISLKEIPKDIQLFHSDDRTKPLSITSTLTAEDLNNGNIFVFHNPTKLLDSEMMPIEITNLTIGVLDNGALHITSNDEKATNSEMEIFIELSLFDINSLENPTRWIDGKAFKNTTLTEILGRSGNSLDRLSTYAYNIDNKKFEKNLKKITIDENGLISSNFLEQEFLSDDELNNFSEPELESYFNSFDFSYSDPMLAFPHSKYNELQLAKDGTVFIVSQNNSGNLFNDGYINISKEENSFTYTKTNENSFVKSALKLEGAELDIMAIYNTNKQTRLDFNGLPVGGVLKHFNVEVKQASAISGFGFAMGAYGEINGYTSPFSGSIAEFITFSKPLEKMDKWIMNAYLLSKWKDYLIVDATHSVVKSYLTVPMEVSQSTILLGGINDDNLTSGSGNDILVGGLGKDSLTGGAGNDRFIVGDGDIITDLEFMSAKDTIDVSELLNQGDEPLSSCLFFQPIDDITIVKVNTDCQGKDLSEGSDFNDASFIIQKQGLWNTDQSELWNNGILYAGNHKATKSEISIKIENTSHLEIIETKQRDIQTFYITIEYGEANGYMAENLEIPILISSEGGRDINLTLNNNLDNNTMVENLLYKYMAYIPSTQLGSQVIKLQIKNNNRKDENQLINIKLGEVPEYYSINPQFKEINISISDGLDKVSVVKNENPIYEGETGFITFMRYGSIESNLIVYIKFEGTSTKGLDYLSPSQRVEFEAGEREVEIEVSTLKDNIKEPKESIGVQILPNEHYIVETSASYTELYLQDFSENYLDKDNDGLLDSWELEYGLNPLISNLMQTNTSNIAYMDTDKDGVNDLEELVFGTNPTKADTDGDGVNDARDLNPLDNKISQDKDFIGYQNINIANQKYMKAPLNSEVIISVPLDYNTSTGDSGLSGLHLQLHYNSEYLEFLGVDETLLNGYESSIVDDEEVYRGDYLLYTKIVNIVWNSLDENWPNRPLSTHLGTAKFKLKKNVTKLDNIIIGIDAKETAEGYYMRPKYISIEAIEPIGLNGFLKDSDYIATDKILILSQALLSLENSLSTVVVNDNKSQEVKNYLNDFNMIYDVDGDGKVNPLTDMVIMFNYFNGVLIEESLSTLLPKEATRTKLSEIKRFIEKVVSQ